MQSHAIASRTPCLYDGRQRLSREVGKTSVRCKALAATVSQSSVTVGRRTWRQTAHSSQLGCS